MQKLILSVLTFFSLFLLVLPIYSVSAHVLKVDDNISALLHVEPNDDPVAGEQSSFFFEFKDKTNQFKPENCDCTFSILENGKQLYFQPLFQNNTNPSLTNASVFYTFPQRDVYVVQVTGKPLMPTAFQSFTLTYDIRVARVSDGNEQTSVPFQSWLVTLWIPLGAVVLIGGAFAISSKDRLIKS